MHSVTVSEDELHIFFAVPVAIQFKTHPVCITKLFLKL